MVPLDLVYARLKGSAVLRMSYLLEHFIIFDNPAGTDLTQLRPVTYSYQEFE